nr:CbiX/SirB N-terminal domain-containing protein [Nitrospiraceae bacterium]
MEHIILIGHGSPRKEANNIDVIGRLLHHAIHPECKGGCVKVAYLQFSEPDITAAIKGCVSAGADRIIIHPFFLSSGMHVTKDIPEIIGEARVMFPDVEFVYTQPLGAHEKL